MEPRCELWFELLSFESSSQPFSFENLSFIEKIDGAKHQDRWHLNKTSSLREFIGSKHRQDQQHVKREVCDETFGGRYRRINNDMRKRSLWWECCGLTLTNRLNIFNPSSWWKTKKRSLWWQTCIHEEKFATACVHKTQEFVIKASTILILALVQIADWTLVRTTFVGSNSRWFKYNFGGWLWL